MPMKQVLRSFGIAVAVTGFVSTLGACEAEPDAGAKEDVAAESEAALHRSVVDLGELPGTGEARTVRHVSPPRYASFTFFANGGEEVDAWVRGARRADAVAWIFDARNQAIAFNDDAPEGGTLDAHLTTKLPASLGTKAKLRIVFREMRLAPATFSVSVRVKPGMFACAADTDCVKVSRGGCCTSWESIAVNSSRAEDYAAQNLCKPPYPPCAPPPDVDDDVARLVPRCEANACVLGPPLGCFYNGAQHSVGENFPSADGCNTCVCGPDGGVGCTKRACLPPPSCDPSKEPNRKYVAHSPEQCMLVRYACEPNTVGFSNACGCGCEQPATCPAFINCMPGPGPSSCAADRARCPYTPVAF